MEISVALATDQLSVAGWPRWMVCGSTVKLLMRAPCGLGGGVVGAVPVVGAGGGGGGGAGALFLWQPAASISNVAQNAAVDSVLLFIRILILAS